MYTMKLTAFVAALVVAVAASANAGDLSKGSLSKMGLSGVTKMTDAQGLNVRGMGSSASVGGFSFSSLGGLTGTYNTYTASAAHNSGSSTAAGASLSVSGAALITPFGSGAFIAGSAGGAVAYAK
jgi:hypothetical protein